MKLLAVTELKHALRLALDNKLRVLACVAAEILFFFLYGLATAPVYQKLVQYTNIIGALASDALASAMREQKSVLDVLFGEALRPYFIDVVLLLIILGAAVFVLYCLLHSFIWQNVLLMTGRKTRYLDYLKRFALISLVWFVFFIIYYFAGFAVDIRSAAIKAIAQQSPSSALHIVLSIYLIVIAYFAVISYVKLDLRESFSVGIKKIRHLVPAWLVFAVYLLILHFLLSQLIKLNPVFGIAAGIILLFPSLVIARIYISLVVEKL